MRIALIFLTDTPSENIVSYCIVTIMAHWFLLRADKVFTRSNDEFRKFGFELCEKGIGCLYGGRKEK